MSERLEYDPEDLPRVKLNTSSGEVVASPENTTLYTFLGRLAVYNHIFLETGRDEGLATGMYIFNSHQVFDDIATFMIDQEFPQVLNRLEVPDCDVAAWEKMVAQQVEDFDTLPDEWDDETK